MSISPLGAANIGKTKSARVAKAAENFILICADGTLENLLNTEKCKDLKCRLSLFIQTQIGPIFQKGRQ